jgi:hypothetical protein
MQIIVLKDLDIPSEAYELIMNLSAADVNDPEVPGSTVANLSKFKTIIQLAANYGYQRAIEDTSSHFRDHRDDE